MLGRLTLLLIDADSGRRLLQTAPAPAGGPSAAVAGAAILANYSSVDVFVEVYGNPNSSFQPVVLELLQPVLDAAMEQQGYEARYLAIHSLL